MLKNFLFKFTKVGQNCSFEALIQLFQNLKSLYQISRLLLNGRSVMYRKWWFEYKMIFKLNPTQSKRICKVLCNLTQNSNTKTNPYLELSSSFKPNILLLKNWFDLVHLAAHICNVDWNKIVNQHVCKQLNKSFTFQNQEDAINFVRQFH